MLTFTKTTDYALQALVYLGSIEKGRVVNVKELAEGHNAPVDLLAKVLQKLAKGGLLVSFPGPKGGYRLTHPLSEVTVAQVIEMIEGPVALTSCLHDGMMCDQMSKCKVKTPLEKIHQEITRYLTSVPMSFFIDTGEKVETLYQVGGLKEVTP